MRKGRGRFSLLAALLLAAPQLAQADLSAFVSIVGFDEEDANLKGSPGLGLRWGKFGRLLGGETSLLVAFPERKIESFSIGEASEFNLPETKETAKAIFYEGRFLVSFPVGMIKPFADVGWGAIITTSTDSPEFQIPADTSRVPLTDEQRRKIEAANKALKAVSKLQHNTAFSYGLGARYGLGKMLDLRVDLRQYVVLSVKGFAAEQVQKELEERAGQDLPLPDLEEKSTTLYKELSVGATFKF